MPEGKQMATQIVILKTVLENCQKFVLKDSEGKIFKLANLSTLLCLWL